VLVTSVFLHGVGVFFRRLEQYVWKLVLSGPDRGTQATWAGPYNGQLANGIRHPSFPHRLVDVVKQTRLVHPPEPKVPLQLRTDGAGSKNGTGGKPGGILPQRGAHQQM
jgi:hypothetical protein